MHNYLILPLMLISCLLPACNKNTTTPLDWQCHHQIETATQRYAEHKQGLNHEDNARILGLIDSAKIQQEHAEYAQCVDSSYRALQLIKAGERSTEPDR